MISRRGALAGALLAAPAWLSTRAFAQNAQAGFSEKAAALERRYGGRLGVAILDTSTASQLAWRGDELFALCSTFKLLAAAFVLARVDRREESLERRVIYSKSDLVPYSPVTEKYTGEEGMTISELCKAAITLSDNRAGNLLLDSFGGPAGLTAFVRSLGDQVTRLDRREPHLNENRPGDIQDTSSPIAMAATAQKLMLGNALTEASRAQLIAWAIANKTGDKRLRAGIPEGWRVGDKTGSGDNRATNDVAIVWPPGRAPLIVSAYYTHSDASDEERNAVLAAVGQIATA